MSFPRFDLKTVFASRFNVLRAALLSLVLSSVSLLFCGAFSIPYINTVYFVKATFNSAPEVVTLGAFGFCLEFSGIKECSGYQSSDFILPSLVPLPQFPLAIVRALTLHVVSFVLALVAVTIILCSHFQNNVLGRWLVETVTVLTLFVAISFIIDLVLFSSTRKAFAQEVASIQIGNGTWLTLTSSIFLLVGIGIALIMPKYAPNSVILDDDESWLDHAGVMDITPLGSELGSEKEEKHSSDMTLGPPNASAIQQRNLGYGFSTREKISWKENASTIADQRPSLTPLRRLPSILINGQRPTEHPTHTKNSPSIVYSSSRPPTTPSAYAPSSYSSYPSTEPSIAGTSTPETLSRSSTILSVSVSHGRQHARRSTQDWFNYEHRMGRRNGRMIASRQFLNSVSTFGSVIPQFPAIPSPPPVVQMASFAFLRDRFFEADPSCNLEARSMRSAAPSSDLELDVQTISSTPRNSYPRELPKIPNLPSRPNYSPQSDSFSLA